MTITMSVALLILRLVVGLTLAAHGAQKLFGWFGGSGIGGTVKMQERMGLKPGWLWTCLVILGEFGGGLSLAFGFLAPLGAAGAVGTMVMAIAKAHWKNGFWNKDRGLEFPLALLTMGVAVGLAGPGNYSLDTPLLFGVLALVALLVDIIGLFISRIPLTKTEVGSRIS